MFHELLDLFAADPVHAHKLAQGVHVRIDREGAATIRAKLFMFQVNWRGQFATIRTFAPLLKASPDGVIVSISSIAAFTGVGSSIAYCAAKAGIDVMTKALARALAPEVRVLAVSPGVVDTAFVPGRGADFNDKVAASTPLKRVGDAEDIAAAVTACITMLRYSTGHIVQVDGGRPL